MSSEIINSKTWNVLWRVEKFNNRDKSDIANVPPDEVVEIKENMLLTAGITALLGILTGDSNYPTFNASNARIWVGDSTTSASAGQTALQASTNKLAMAMDGSYPSVSGGTVTFRATYGSSDANYAWEEVGVSNGATLGTYVKMLNRKVSSFGTKGSGSTWTITVEITIS